MGLKDKLMGIRKEIKEVLEPIVIKELENVKNQQNSGQDQISQEELMKYWANNFKTFNEQTIAPATVSFYEFLRKDIVILNDRVNRFIKWYKKNIVDASLPTISIYAQEESMRNLIEKFAVWYEIKYPDALINEKIANKDDDSRFNRDAYFSKEAFMKSLSKEEKIILENLNYPEIVYWNLNYRGIHVHIDSKGFVTCAEFLEMLVPGMKDEEFIGKHITEVYEILKSNVLEVPSTCEFSKVIKEHNDWEYQKEEFLNCVMYRILERGVEKMGAKRAYLFAKEFNRCKDIPMAYGVDLNDPELRVFINRYLLDGGTSSLNCYVGYNYHNSKINAITPLSIAELLKRKINGEENFYTLEERNLQARLVGSLANNINEEKLQEYIRQQRTERKLEKSLKK